MSPRPDPARSRNIRPRSLSIIGIGSFNFQIRLAQEFASAAFDFPIHGYDLKPRQGAPGNIPWIQVHDNRDLAGWLARHKPSDVLIETPDHLHLEHIRLALANGAERVYCEKCIGPSAVQARAALARLEQEHPGQQVFIIDHYLQLQGIWSLLALAPEWLGRVKQVNVILEETVDVPPHQEASHAAGMANFFHHAVALGGLWFDLEELAPCWSGWARYPGARVPDTYRAALYSERRSGVVVLQARVGKKLARGNKLIHVVGAQGEAWLDRDGAVLRLCHDDGDSGTSTRVPLPRAETGYQPLVHGLAAGRLPERLLTPAQAVRVLELVEQAHEQAEEVPAYEREDYVCDWQLARTRMPGPRKRSVLCQLE